MPKPRFTGRHDHITRDMGRCYATTKPSVERALGERIVVANPADRLNCCWLVDGVADVYASVQGKRAHRVAYTTLVGPIPKGHVIHHLCENPGCVNPRHLEALTKGEHTSAHAALRRERAA